MFFLGYLKVIALIAGVPLLEFLVLRFYFHHIRGFSIGYRGMTDYDWLLPTLIAFFFLMIPFTKRNLPHFGLRRNTLILHFVLFLGSLAFSFPASTGLRVGWFLWNAATLLSSGFLFVSPSYFSKHEDKILLIPFALLSLSKLLSQYFLAFLWEPLSAATGQTVFKLTHALNSSVTHRVFHSLSGNTYTHVSHPLHTLSIGVGCSGMEAMAFGAFALVLSFFIDRKRFNFSQWALFGFGIVVWMYLANLLRLTLLFFVSLLIFKLASYHFRRREKGLPFR